MNKWTALASVILAAILGGFYWFYMQKRLEVASPGTAVPAETDGQVEEFETDSDLADSEGLLEGPDGPGADLPPIDANAIDSSNLGGAGTSGVDALEDPDESAQNLQDPIVIEDTDGHEPTPQKSTPSRGP
jgi:hypothetical protein